MIVEPMAGDRVEDNLNPVGRAYYGFSTFLCTPASLSQEVGLALGAQAGEARIGDVVVGRRVHAASGAPPRRRSTSCSKPGREHYDRPRGPERHRDPGARCPTSRASSSATGSGSTGSLRARRARRSCSCPRGRSCTRAVEGPDPLPRAPLSRRRRSTAAATGSPTARPRSAAYASTEFVADAVAVLDAAGVERRPSRGLSMGGVARAAARRGAPRARRGVVAHRATVPSLVPSRLDRARAVRRRARRRYEGWAKYNRHYWLRDYRGFLEFFFGEIFPEPHSTKQIEDCVAWGLDTTPRR